MLIGLAFIVLGAVATAVSGGSFMAAFVCGLTYAAKSAVSGAIMGAVLGCLTSAFRGENALEGLRQGFVDGFADGFMWGGITAGLSNVVKPGSFCFIAGTKVLTDHGHKNIEDIEVGDLVLAYDEETGETAYKPVVQLFRNTTKEWYHIQAADEKIICTGEHPFYVIGKGFIKACELNCRDKLLNAHGAVVLIDSIWVEQLGAEQTTYNFEVADYHTYYVSELHILVHNRCKLGKNMEKAGTKFKPTEDAHHLYPRQFERKFFKVGIKVDDAVNGIAMDAKLHRSKAYAYNKMWEQVIDTINEQNVRGYMQQFMKEIYGIIV